MKLRERIAGFFDTSSILTYVIGTATLTIALQWLYDLFKMAFSAAPDWGQILGGFLMALLLVGIAVGVIILQIQKERRALAARKTRVVIDELKQVPADMRPGLVSLVSPRKGKAKTTTDEAIEWFGDNLTHCWLLATSGSLATALEIRDKLIAERGPKVRVWCPESVSDGGNLIDSEDAKTTYERVSAILDSDRMGLETTQIYADVTGSQKPATIGVALACIERNVDLVYVKAARSPTGEVKTDDAAPVLIRIDAAHLEAKTAPNR